MGEAARARLDSPLRPCSQYASYAYRKQLERRGIVATMSRWGNCYDNALSESFVLSFKTEWMPAGDYETRAGARAATGGYSEILYDHRRRHSSIGGISPARYERRQREQAA